MYDFHFGSKDEIVKRPVDFLIFCKRLLPRWANGIPDSECVSIFELAMAAADDSRVLIETGSGASTLALFLATCLKGGKVYSWDTSGGKGSFLRQVISESIGRSLTVDPYKKWTFIPFDSTDRHVGIPVLRELGESVGFAFFDSLHTLDHLTQEVELTLSVASGEMTIAIDDGYYRSRHYNYAFSNMIRTKLGLGPVDDTLDDNTCSPFYIEIEEHLRKRCRHVEAIECSYKRKFRNDLFFSYYAADRESMNRLGMEDESELEHRFDAWFVRM